MSINWIKQIRLGVKDGKKAWTLCCWSFIDTWYHLILYPNVPILPTLKFLECQEENQCNQRETIKILNFKCQTTGIKKIG